MEWIKVIEKLPEIGKDVLTYGEYEHVIAAIDEKGDWHARDTDFETGEPWLCDKNTVTHWMLLPETPNK